MRVRLVPLDPGIPIEIDKDLIVIGRNEVCDVQLAHKSISKLHCVIVKTDGLLLIRDLGSTNGTRVNGTRIRRGALMPDDQVKIASLAYRVDFSAKSEKKPNPEEYTQRLDAAEVAELMKKDGRNRGTDREDSEADEVPSVNANSLPDVYSDEEQDEPET